MNNKRWTKTWSEVKGEDNKAGIAKWHSALLTARCFFVFLILRKSEAGESDLAKEEENKWITMFWEKIKDVLSC